MYQKLMSYMKSKPTLYEPSSAPFWDDEHISKHMLEAHLNPDIDAASRNHEFIQKSVCWIANYCKVQPGMKLLDLGCGPGIYDEKLYKEGFCVTGIDFSHRSIDYAIQHAEENHMDIRYIYLNYLEIDYQEEYDVIILVYCDLGVLPVEDRKILLRKIYGALKKGGRLIIDADTRNILDEITEGTTIQYNESGFWSSLPHLCIQRQYKYDDTYNYLNQYIIITEDECNCYNIWNQTYSEKSMFEELTHAGFADVEFFDNVAGDKFTGKADTLCAVARKGMV